MKLWTHSRSKLIRAKVHFNHATSNHSQISKCQYFEIDEEGGELLVLHTHTGGLKRRLGVATVTVRPDRYTHTRRDTALFNPTCTESANVCLSVSCGVDPLPSNMHTHTTALGHKHAENRINFILSAVGKSL